MPPRDPSRPKGLNALGLLARHPALTRAFNTFNGHVLFATTLSPRQRELLVLRVAALRDSTYEWTQHVVLAGDAGLTPDEIDAVRRGIGGRRAGRRSTVPSLPRPTSSSPTRGSATPRGRSLAAELDDQQLMDVVFTVGAYDLVAMAFETFDVELDDDLRKWSSP